MGECPRRLPGVEAAANLTYCAINPDEDAFHLFASLFLLISEFLRTSKKIAAEKHQIIPQLLLWMELNYVGLGDLMQYQIEENLDTK